MERAIEAGFIKGCQVGRENVMISHLQFANDTFFFVEQGGSSFKNLLMLVGLFCSVLGLKINMAKSTLLGMRVDEEIVISMAESVDCGLPLIWVCHWEEILAVGPFGNL